MMVIADAEASMLVLRLMSTMTEVTVAFPMGTSQHYTYNGLRLLR